MSTNPPALRYPTSLHLHEQDAPTRARIEHFIHTRFAESHGADVHDFLPTLVSCSSPSGDLMAAAGFQLASAGTLFLEAYLDQPVENCLAPLSEGLPARSQIVEVGNLATSGPGRSQQLIMALTAWFDRRQLQWAVLTLTPTLINSFRRLGLQPQVLAPAIQERLHRSRSNWGHYYDNHPQVVAVSIPQSAALLRQGARPAPFVATIQNPLMSEGACHHV